MTKTTAYTSKSFSKVQRGAHCFEPIWKTEIHPDLFKMLLHQNSDIEPFFWKFQETESRLRNEVEKIKKKMAVTIHELEMSLDAANKSNVQLQNTSKQQSTRIMELTQGLDHANKNLQVY